jgi:hypothetical protein
MRSVLGVSGGVAVELDVFVFANSDRNHIFAPCFYPTMQTNKSHQWSQPEQQIPGWILHHLARDVTGSHLSTWRAGDAGLGESRQTE